MFIKKSKCALRFQVTVTILAKNPKGVSFDID